MPSMRGFICSFVSAVAAAAAVHPAWAQHVGDIGLSVVEGRLVTGEISASGLGAERLVFTGQFGSTGSPHFTSDPGFDALPGTFAVGTRVGFRFTGPVLVWNGSAFEPTSPAGPMSGERVRGAFLTLNATSTDAPTPGFDLAVQSNGGWHRHLSWTLLPATGEVEPQPGAYLVPLAMYSTDPAVGESAPFAIVMGDGVPDEVLAEAAAAAEVIYAGGSACLGDLNGNGTVDGADLGALLSAWGTDGPGDLNADGVVNGADLGSLLSAWGPCAR
jgi:hypothetical protein